MKLRILVFFSLLGLSAVVVRFWFIVFCVLFSILVFGPGSYGFSFLFAIVSLVVYIIISKQIIRCCEVTAPRFRDLYAYMTHTGIRDYLRQELKDIFVHINIKNLIRRLSLNIRYSLYSIIAALLFLLVFPHVFMMPMSPVVIFTHIPDMLSSGETVSISAYSPEKLQYTLTINGERILSQYGFSVRHTMVIHEDLHIRVGAGNETFEKTIRMIPLPSMHDIHISLIHPAYIRDAALRVPDGLVFRDTVWAFDAKVSDSVRMVIVRNGLHTTHILPQENISARVKLTDETISVSLRDDVKEYNAGSYRYTIIDDDRPSIQCLTSQGVIYFSAQKPGRIVASVSDDWGLAQWRVINGDTVLLQNHIHGQEMQLDIPLENMAVYDGMMLTVRVYDIKGQYSSAEIMLREMNDEVKNERISEFTTEITETAGKNDEKLSELTDSVQHTLDQTRLHGEVNKDMKESLQKMQEHIDDIGEMLKESAPILDNDQERYIREVAQPELKALAEEIAELLQTTDLRMLQEQTEKIEKKLDSVASMLKNFRDALKQLKKTQALNALISAVEHTSDPSEINTKMNEFLRSNQDPMIEHAAAQFAKNNNKQELLDSLKKLRDLMSGKANDEMREVIIRIIGEALAWSDLFEERIQKGSATLHDIVIMKEMLSLHDRLINELGAGVLYVGPEVMFSLSELSVLLDRVQLNRGGSYKHVYDTHLVLITQLLKTLDQSQQRAQQLNAGQLSEMLKDILGQQQTLSNEMSSMTENSENGNSLSDSLKTRQHELAEKMGELGKKSEGSTQKRIDALRDEMNRIAEDMDLARKKSMSKTMELKLEKLISDMQSGDPSEKRKRELVEKLLTGKQKKDTADEEWKKRVRELRKLINDKEFGYEIDRYYRRLLDK